MKKIFVALSSARYNAAPVEYACRLAGLHGAHITGVFVEAPDIWPMFVPAGDMGTPLMPDIGTYMPPPPDREELAERIRAATAHFAETCVGRNAQHSLHTSGAVSEDALVHLTQYADVLVLDAGFSGRFALEDEQPTELVRTLLSEARCPVVVAPHTPGTDIRALYFAYDGSASSVFAIKQAVYLMPGLRHLPVRVLEVHDKDEPRTGDDELLQAWLASYFSDVAFEFLKGEAEKSIHAHLAGKSHALLVMGAFGRSAVSQFFRHSTAEKLLESPGCGVFVAHR